MSTSTPSLNVVALISGGKDSLYCLLHCLAHGHKVVALANLYPPKQAPPSDVPQGIDTTAEWDEDVDSFMYQTAGHTLIPLLSKTLRLPLYRQEITGHARDAAPSYSGHDEDETEALVPLLNTVKDAHPEVNAVCSGAILSTYQRTRVESVAIRLGLTPLAFLWQYPALPPLSQDGLIEDMGKAGFDVRIIKVASGGLNEGFLWRDLTTSGTRGDLAKSLSRFGGNVLGEGGEYETMVVSGPSSVRVIQMQYVDHDFGVTSGIEIRPSINRFWKGRVHIDDENKRINGTGSECWILSFKSGTGKVSIQDTFDSSSPNPPDQPLLGLPNIWDKPFYELLMHVRRERPRDPRNSQNVTDPMVPGQPDVNSISELLRENLTIAQPAISDLQLTNFTHVTSHRNLIVIANIPGLRTEPTVREQMESIIQELINVLKKLKRPTSSIVFTTIILQSMSDFAVVNSIYGELFDQPNPPTRVTIGSSLPDGMKVLMSVTVFMGDKSDALHVQSRSYWAPANIGPYSQAIRMPCDDASQASLVFIAGQIPLVPASMELLAPADNISEGSQSALSPSHLEFLPRCCLSLQHLWRIGREMKVEWWTGAIAFITRGEDRSLKASLAWTVWWKAHKRKLWEHYKEDNPIRGKHPLGLWRTVYWRHPPEHNDEHNPSDIDKGKSKSPPVFHASRERIPPEQADELADEDIPGFFAVEVDGLPRGSDIEWQSLGVAQSWVMPILITACFDDTGLGEIELEFRICAFCDVDDTFKSVAFVSIPFHPASDEGFVSRNMSRARDLLWNASDRGNMLITIYTPEKISALDLRDKVIVPCRAVLGSEGQRLSAGIVIQSTIKLKNGMEATQFTESLRQALLLAR